MHIDNVIFLILSKNAYTKFSAGPLSQKGYFYPCSAPFDYSLAEKKHPLSTRQRVFLFNEINPFRDL